MSSTGKHPMSPCSTCPYRKDAPRGYWSDEEFRDLLAREATPMGTLYACHGFAKKTHADRGLCAGWLLDQKRRNVPSIRLRMLLLSDPAAVRAIEEVTDGGVKLFASVEAMCRANGVRSARSAR